MAFRKVAGTTKYYKLNECEEGDVLVEGIYVGEIEGKFGPQSLFREKNQKVVIGGRHLMYLLENEASEGDIVRVTYAGQETLTSGKFKGKPVHKFELEVDDEANTDTSDQPAEEEVEEEEVEEEVKPVVKEKKKVAKKPATKKKTKVRKKVEVEEVEDDEDYEDIEL